MTTQFERSENKLEQLLDNFRLAAIVAYECDYEFSTDEELKAAQEAIVAHVEGLWGMLGGLVVPDSGCMKTWLSTFGMSL